MQAPPRSWSRLAAAGLAVAAAVGLFLGLTRTSPGSGDTRSAATSESEPVPSAKPIAGPPPPAALDEAAVRRIARQEADAALAKSDAAPAPAPSPKPKTPRPDRPKTPQFDYPKPDAITPAPVLQAPPPAAPPPAPADSTPPY